MTMDVVKQNNDEVSDKFILLKYIGVSKSSRQLNAAHYLCMLNVVCVVFIKEG